jgi:prepilin-type N-terminal cleavage/methylation domain-containing protein
MQSQHSKTKSGIKIMKNKAFTVLELLVVIVIIAVFGGIALSWSNSGAYDTGEINPYWNPAAANAQANQRMVEEMAEQNRLQRELIELQKSKQP